MAIIDRIGLVIDSIFYKAKNFFDKCSEVFWFSCRVINYISYMLVDYVADKLSHIPLFRVMAGTNPELERELRLWVAEKYTVAENFISNVRTLGKHLFDKKAVEIAGLLNDTLFLRWYASDDKLLTLAGNICRGRYSPATLNIIKSMRDPLVLFNGTWGIANQFNSIFKYAVMHSDYKLVKYLFDKAKERPTGRIDAHDRFIPMNAGNDLRYTMNILFESLDPENPPLGVTIIKNNDIKNPLVRELIYKEVSEFFVQNPNIPKGNIVAPLYKSRGAFISWEFKEANIKNLDILMGFDNNMSTPSRVPPEFLHRLGEAVVFIQDSYSYYKDQPKYKKSSTHILNKVIDLIKRGKDNPEVKGYFENFDNLEETPKATFANYIKSLSFMLVHANSGKLAEKLLEQIPSNYIKTEILDQSTKLLTKICDREDKFNTHVELLTFLHAKKLDVSSDKLVIERSTFPFVYQNTETAKNFDLQVRVMRRVMDSGISYSSFCDYINVYQKLMPLFRAGFEKNSYKDNKNLPPEIRYLCYNYLAGTKLEAKVIDSLYEIFLNSKEKVETKNKFEKVADGFVKVLNRKDVGINI